MAFKDVVVLLPGITGSVLANASGKEVWALGRRRLARASPASAGRSRASNSAGDGDRSGVTAPRLVPDVTIVPGLIKIDGYTRIEQTLIAQLGLEKGKNFFAFPYDWRRDNRVNAKRLRAAGDGLAAALARLVGRGRRQAGADRPFDGRADLALVPRMPGRLARHAHADHARHAAPRLAQRRRLPRATA